MAAISASAANPYEVTVPAGTYYLDAYLYMGSNTTLNLTDCTIIRTKGTNIVRVGASEDAASGVVGYAYENVGIIGGVLNGNGTKETLVKATHCRNFTMTGTTLMNNINGHLMEVAGVDGLTVSGCVFRDQAIVGGTVGSLALAYEALQIDVLYSKHMNGTRSEALPTRNVNVSNCTFLNVPRGIGSHTAIMNAPTENISITECVFDQTPSCAIQSLNWTNVTIKNNTITNAPRGIAIYYTNDDGNGTYLSSVLAADGGIPSSIPTTYIPNDKQNILISDNTITLYDAKDPYSKFVKGAIVVAGCNITTVKAQSNDSGSLPVGNYYISDVTIKNNTITTYGNGIRATDAQNVKIDNNTVTCMKSSVKDYSDEGAGNLYGIQARELCTDISITKNKIYNAVSNGIYVSAKSKATKITDNTIDKAGKNGIDIEKSTCDLIQNNTINTPKLDGIFVYDSATVTNILDNTITTPKQFGIDVNQKSKGVTIQNNTITKSGAAGICIRTDAKATTIRDNTITSAKTDGIKLTSDSVVKNILNNTIKKAGQNGIYANFDSTVTTISGNKIYSSKKYGIDIEHSVAKTVKKNTVKDSVSNGIYIFDKAEVTTLSDNKVLNSKKNGIDVEGSTVDSITNNTVTKSSVTGIFVYNKATATTINLNKITTTGNQGISINTKSTAGKITDNTIKKTTAYGIAVGANSKATSITKNKFESCKSGKIVVSSDSKVKTKQSK